MRKYFLIIIFLATARFSFSQYTVTKVVGNVKKISGEGLKTGSTLSDNDVLLFSTPNDLVRVIVAGKGIFVINPSPKAAPKPDLPGTVMEVLKSTMHVKPKEGYLSGRSESSEAVPEIFETDASINRKNLIRENNRYLFDPHKYDLRDGSRFFLQISYEGMKPVIHALKTNADTLLLDANDFKTSVSDTSIKAKYAIGFYSKEKGKSELLADLDPYFDFSGEAEAIIKVVVAQSKTGDKTALQQECLSEVYGALGKPSDIDLKNAISIAMRK